MWFASFLEKALVSRLNRRIPFSSLVDALVVAVAHVARSLPIGQFPHLGFEFLETRFPCRQP